jgi:predicted ATPase/DNA-binding XRE family transcriptional regulator
MSMSEGITFGGWLKQRRKELGISQDELADAVGFSPSLLWKIEADQRRPSVQIASLLADYLRIPTDERDAFVTFARTGHSQLDVAVSDAVPSEIRRRAPWRGVYLHQTNLPSALTPLIGREREEAAVRDHLLRTRTRLLTLTGTPGIGKTRLSLQVASTLVEHFEDGIFFVDLAPIANPDLVMPTVAQTLGLKAAEGRSSESALFDYVRERRMLLLLDNFEQVLDAAATIAKLLEASPWLKVLVTSREALHIRGERRFPVPPLGLPEKSEGSGNPLRALLTPDEFAAYPAVKLFIERAQAVTPDFVLTEENAVDVAALCIGLEGIPLAIELAAAHARHFSAADMRSALGNQLRLLTGGTRDLPARHRSLRAAIEWSYNLLGADEQAVFRSLGVFTGGFTSEALESIWEGVPNLPAPLDTLLSLVDKHLVREERSTPGSRGMRFGLLEAVREYAQEQMQKRRETDRIRGRHADYYLSLAESAEQHFMGSQHPGWGAKQLEWINTLRAELDNIRAAIDWYEAQAQTEVDGAINGKEIVALDNLEKGLRLATFTRRVWFGYGHSTEGIQRLMALVSMVPKPVATRSRQFQATYAMALLVVGRLYGTRGGTGPLVVGPLLQESLSIFTELDDKQRMALNLFILGAVALSHAEYDAGRRYSISCLKLYRELGDKWGTAAALQQLGDIEIEAGNLVSADPLLEESLALFQEVGEAFGAASSLESLGRSAYYQGDYARARTLWMESLQRRRELGLKGSVGQLFALLGWAAIRENNYAAARASFREGLLIAREAGAISPVYWSLVGCGILASRQGHAGRAARLFGAAEALREAGDIQLSSLAQEERDTEIMAARSQLDEGAWDRAWAEGHAMTLEGAIMSALRQEAR